MANNGWAAKKAAEKRDKKMAAASYAEHKQLKRKAERDGSITKRVRNERPATAAKRERKAIYGKYNPSNAVSLCCHMMIIGGCCSGCGE